jgi:hypothetical protein
MIIVRILVSLLAYVAGNALVFWMLSPSTPGGEQAFVASVIAIVGGMAAAVGVWMLPMWKGRATLDPSTLEETIKWALVVGAVGFCGGFFGPMIVAPDANQGPLLGLFITGPVGVLIGAVGGFIYARARQR